MTREIQKMKTLKVYRNQKMKTYIILLLLTIFITGCDNKQSINTKDLNPLKVEISRSPSDIIQEQQRDQLNDLYMLSGKYCKIVLRRDHVGVASDATYSGQIISVKTNYIVIVDRSKDPKERFWINKNSILIIKDIKEN